MPDDAKRRIQDFLLQRYGQQGELAQGDLFSRGGVVSDYLFAKDRLFASLNLSDDEMVLYDRKKPDPRVDWF